MRCPHCSRVLVTLDFCDIEVDYCYTCGGIWLDNGEIEHLTAGDGDEFLNMDGAEVNEKKRRCPLCRRSMEKVLMRVGEGVVLDRCRAHGIWTDAGELRKILNAACREGRPSRMIQLLDEMFAARKHEGGCL